MEVIAYDICLSFSGSLHSVRSSPGPSMSLEMALFHSFSWTDNIPLYMKTILKAVQHPHQKKSVSLVKKSCVFVSHFYSPKLMFSLLMQDSCLWERMNEGRNYHWHASISKDYFKTAFIKDVSVNRNLTWMCLWCVFTLDTCCLPGLYLFRCHFLYFHLGSPFHCSVPDTSEILLECNCLLWLDFIAKKAEEVCVRIFYRL